MLNLLISIVFCVLSSVIGLIVNLYFPKMEWTNPTTVVKQSASVMITILSILLLILGVVGITILLTYVFNINNIDIVLIIVLAVFLIMLFISIRALNNIGSEKFNKL